MQRPAKPLTSPRKSPVQARSIQLVDAILTAAIRVLEREGAARFTTIRVAEAAGVSVGSLYQYFPNKQAILFRLQLDEWERTGAIIEEILGDRTRSPAARLHAVVLAFFQSERDEAPLRLALDAATPDYHSAPEAREQRRKSERIVTAFIAEAAPQASPRQRKFAAALLFETLTALGKQLSDRRQVRKETEHWAREVARMLSKYLRGLKQGGKE